jgi:hypothetical protein
VGEEEWLMPHRAALWGQKPSLGSEGNRCKKLNRLTRMLILASTLEEQFWWI